MDRRHFLNAVISSSATLAAPLSTETQAASCQPSRGCGLPGARPGSPQYADVALEIRRERLPTHGAARVEHADFPPERSTRSARAAARVSFQFEVMFARWPVRAHTIDNNKQYIRRVIRETSRRKIRFSLEVKETVTGVSPFFLRVAPSTRAA